MKKLIVTDANILIRSVLGKRVSQLLEQYSEKVELFTTATCYDEARQHLPNILKQRNESLELYLAIVDSLETIVSPLGEDIYGPFEEEARRRIGLRDERDWPLLALALALDCPVWTEDHDFFGTGVATWNTQNVETYLSS